MRRIVVAAAGAAVVGMAACSHPAGPGTSSAQTSGVSVPVSCSQRYHTWANPTGNALLATFHVLGAAAAAGDSRALTVALDKARPAVTRATLHPVPACADPRGYWSVLLMHVNAAVGGNPSTSSVKAALKDVPAIEGNLTAELKSASR